MWTLQSASPWTLTAIPYVSGNSRPLTDVGGFAVVKYDANGNEQWVTRYDGVFGSPVSAHAMASDAEANVYVAAWLYHPSPSNNYLTVKYDKFGNEQWAIDYDGPDSGADEAYGIDVGADGSVYVTGDSDVYNSGWSQDYATVKYDANGNEVWAARYDGIGGGDDFARAIAVDAKGNVYVTGSSTDLQGRYDYATVKYDTNGNEQWVARYDGCAYAVVVDANGNAYVTGTSTGDYVTIKYDANRNELWAARYDGTHHSDSPTCMVIDAYSNVYVTGRSVGLDLTYDYATVKYDTSGNEQWVARYNRGDDDYASAVAIDDQGNIYVTGRSMDLDNNLDYATLKYDSNGNEQWVARYDGLMGDSEDKATGIAVGADGSVFVTGGSEGFDTGFDYVTINYSSGPSDPPIADFTANVATGTFPLTVQFTDQSIGSPTGWVWNFGDGGSSTLQNPSYTYTSAGNFTVSLTVDGPGGTDSATKMDYITVYTPAVADFSGAPTMGTAPLSVTFTDASTGDIDTWSWDFGDGGSSTEQNPLYTYIEGGDFTVTLTVIGPGGYDTEVKEAYIHVSEAICECDLVPDATTISRGGTLGFDITVSNNTDEVQVFGFATYVTKPGGGKYPPSGYLIGPARVSLNPYGSKSAHRSLPIPGHVPVGTYTYYGVVGTLGAGLYDKCQFEFEVTAP